MNLSGFSRVDVSDAFEVDIRQSEQYGVVVQVDSELVDDLIIEKSGDTLKIGLDPHRLTNFNGKTLKAEISMPELIDLELSGASRAYLHNLRTDSALRIATSGASRIEGQLEVSSVRFTVSGASDVELSGSARTLTLDASGASEVDLGSFVVGDADAGVSGASEALIAVNDSLRASTSGSSSLRFKGNPKIERMHSSGGSSIKRLP